MLDTINSRAGSVGDMFFNASRQVWLAGLGAAVVTRDWVQYEANTVFRNLIREGTVVESRAVRFVGDRLDTSFMQANTLWKRARRTVTTTVQAYADTAATLVRQSLPSQLPNIASKGEARSKPVVKRVSKISRKPTPPRRPAKRVKHTVKSAGKRA